MNPIWRRVIARRKLYILKSVDFSVELEAELICVFGSINLGNAHRLFHLGTRWTVHRFLCVSSQELVGDNFQSQYRVGKRDGDELLPPHSPALPGLLINRLPVRCRGQERQCPCSPSLGASRGCLHRPATKWVRNDLFRASWILCQSLKVLIFMDLSDVCASGLHC